MFRFFFTILFTFFSTGRGEREEAGTSVQGYRDQRSLGPKVNKPIYSIYFNQDLLDKKLKLLFFKTILEISF